MLLTPANGKLLNATTYRDGRMSLDDDINVQPSVRGRADSVMPIHYHALRGHNNWRPAGLSSPD